MDKSNRWVVLEHIGSPDDPKGVHFDLLLEDLVDCRSWRLNQIPILDGPPQKVSPINAHSLSWLETKGRLVSGGRGWAKPVRSGFFKGGLPENCGDSICLELHTSELVGCLEIIGNLCKLSSMVSGN